MCKLFKVLGHKLDNSTKREFRDRVRVYFERMKVLAEDQSLDERVRLMVQVRIGIGG